MIKEYNNWVKELEDFLNKNSLYEPRVVKNYTSTSTYFPIISFPLNNTVDTDYCTIDKIEKYDAFYLTLDVYTKDTTINGVKIASQEINDELTDLIIKFFNSKNMKRTLCKPTPNADKNILRRTIQYQGLYGNARGNIIRR